MFKVVLLVDVVNDVLEVLLVALVLILPADEHVEEEEDEDVPAEDPEGGFGRIGFFFIFFLLGACVVIVYVYRQGYPSFPFSRHS